MKIRMSLFCMALIAAVGFASGGNPTYWEFNDAEVEAITVNLTGMIIQMNAENVIGHAVCLPNTPVYSQCEMLVVGDVATFQGVFKNLPQLVVEEVFFEPG